MPKRETAPSKITNISLLVPSGLKFNFETLKMMSNSSETSQKPHLHVIEEENWHALKDRENNVVDEEESYSYAKQLVNCIVLPMALHSAIELGVFEVLAKSGPNAKLSAKGIADQISSKNPEEAPAMLDRILRLLASHSVIDCSVDNNGVGSFQRIYGLNSVSEYFVANSDGVSLGPVMALIQDGVFLKSWSQLKAAVLQGGIPFNRIHGMHAFEYPGLDSRFNEVFNKAMTNSTSLSIKKILQIYKGFEQINNRLVDVGGGHGIAINMITLNYPHIKGVNFDLPHVIQSAPSYSGVEHVGGDMFQSVPKGDAIFLKYILHDWSDEQCLKLLKNCYDAIPHNGKVIVVEAVLPLMPNNSSTVKTTCQGDILMMTQNPGGKERTEQEFMDLATRSGFTGIRFDCFVCDLWVMEFFK